MPLILTVTLPLFALILAGYVTAWRGLIDEPGIRGLTGFVFYFALPLMLFQNIASAPVADEFDGAFAATYLAAGLVVHLTGLAVARFAFGCTLSEQGIQGLASSFGNTSFIALAVAVALFGDAANLPMAMTITIENAILMPFTIALLEVDRSERGAFRRALLAALAAVVRNPVVMSVVLGAVAALVGIEFAPILDGFLDLVSGAAIPSALFALGATLAGLPMSEKFRETAFMVAMKLIAYPALVYAMMVMLLPDIDPVWRAVAVISASAPMGANVYLLAVRYDAYVARSSTAVLASTAVSMLTVTALASVLG